MEKTVEQIMAELEAAKAELNAMKEKEAKRKASRKPRPSKVDPAVAEARVKFETIEYAPEGTALRALQEMGRAVHVYAFYKVIKHLSYDRLARLLFSLCEEVAGNDGRDVQDVIAEVTTRVPKAPKATETEAPAEETAEA